MTHHTFDYAENINGHFEVALSVEIYAAVGRAYREALSKGAVSPMTQVTEPWGQRTFYIANPESNLVEAGSFTP